MPYSASFKQQILLQHRSGECITSLSKSFGISRSTIYRWLQEESPVETADKHYSPYDIQILERRIEKLENIIAILKSVPCTVHAPLKERLNALEELQGLYNVHTLCEALNVSRGTYYNHILRNKRSNVWYRKREEEYRILIHDIYYEFDQIFGTNKIHAIMKERGHPVTAKYVARIMQDLGLSSIRTDSKRTYISLNRKPTNILQQQFQTSAPNQVWISDVTCFKYDDKWLYICVVIDLYSRMVIGWHIGRRNSTQLVSATLRKACTLRTPSPGVIFHTDRGTPYRSKSFVTKLEEHSLVQSLSRPRKPHDNAVVESFFSSMKREALYRREYKSEAAFRECVAAYIDFYNTRRPHSTLKHQTPAQFEQAYYDSVARQGSDC